MPFLLYNVEKLGPDTTYRDPSHVKLGGGGLVQAAAREFLRGDNSGWHVPVADLIRCAGRDPERHALVVDAAPSRSTLNLFDIEFVSGYSYQVWTPIMFTFKTLFADEEHDIGESPDAPMSIDDHKKHFQVDSSDRPRVRSFLYLTGGYESGTWNWGGNSRTTAALLWPDAWAHFVSCTLNE